MAIDLDVDSNLDKAVGMFAAAKARLKDLRPAMTVPAERVKALIDSTFATSADPSGSPWPVLAPSTIKSKMRLGFSTKPLIRHGARGLQGQTTSVPTTTGIRVGIPASVSYGRFHQEGIGQKVRAFLPFVRAGAGWIAMNTPAMNTILKDMDERVARYVMRGER